MARLEIDGSTFEVSEGQNLLQACLSEKLDLPYFCWHPSLGSVGACRQCAVVEYADADDERGRLVMACMTPVRDGARFAVTAARAREFRASVIEWLMQNHPHDCPVCEEGGECHLQDMTVMTGHTTRRYQGRKRTWTNQYLGPFIGHEMNRCITCYRCVRYYRDYAGGTDLQAFGSRSRMYFGREADGVLENAFAGNLVEVCPTGVFTDKPFSRTYTRKWDLRSAPSVCPGCAVGCNVFPAERYGTLKRIHNRYHSQINGYFLCDRGRFGSHFVNSEKRLRHAGRRSADGVFDEIDEAAAVAQLAKLIADQPVIGIGSPRASLESNLALKSLVGEASFTTGCSTQESRLNERILGIHRARGARIPTLAEVERADAVLVLGEDVLNTAPRVALALRQATRNRSFTMAVDAGIPRWQDAGVRGHAQDARSPMLIASLLPTGLDDVAAGTLRAAPEELAAAGFAIAHRIDPRYVDTAAVGSTDFIQQATDALLGAERPLIVAGTGCGSEAVLEAAANVAWALDDAGHPASLLLTGLEANSMGLTLLGGGMTLDDALSALQTGAAAAAIVLENDLYRRAAPATVDAAFDAAAELVVLDLIESRTAEKACLVVPSASYAESTGTFVSCEARAQRFYQVFEPPAPVRPAWRWLVDAAEAAGRNDLRWHHIDDATGALAGLDDFRRLQSAFPPAGRRSAGRRVPRQTHRATGRTAMTANVNVHEPKPTIDEETPLSYTMEGALGTEPGTLLPYVWSPGWNSNQSVFKFQQEVAGPLAGGDPGVRLLEPNGAGPAPVTERWSIFTTLTFPGGSGLRPHPVHHIFGSDELSALSPPIRERGSGPRIYLNPADAERLGLTDGGGARCGDLGSFQVRVEPALAPGHAGLTVGDTAVIGASAIEPRPDPDFVPPPGDNLIARG